MYRKGGCSILPKALWLKEVENVLITNTVSIGAHVSVSYALVHCYILHLTHVLLHVCAPAIDNSARPLCLL